MERKNTRGGRHTRGKRPAELDRGADAEEDFAQEGAWARGNRALRELLAERSREPGRYSLEQVREKLGLRPL